MWSKIRDEGEVLFLAVAIRFYRLYDYLRTVWLYYGNRTFRRVDRILISAYLFDNPYTLSRRYLQSIGEKDIYSYGETPLQTLEIIAKRAHITAGDTVFELGSGRGRSCFWLSSFIGCRVVGIEYIPLFVWKAKRIAERAGFDGTIQFRCEDFLASDLHGATVVYLYGSNLEDVIVQKLIDRLITLPSGTRLITVSFALDEYTPKPLFPVIDNFDADFFWGSATVYIQTRA